MGSPVKSGIAWLQEQKSATVEKASQPDLVALERDALAINNGGYPDRGLLVLTDQAIHALSQKFLNHTLILRTPGQVDQTVTLGEAKDLISTLNAQQQIGIPYTGQRESILQTLYKARFPNGTVDLEEFSLAESKLPKTQQQLRAENDFFETIKACALPPEQYHAWIHVHSADFGINQHELDVGGWMQIDRQHLKYLARTSPNMLLMMRDEESPAAPALRWRTITAKSALFADNEKRSKQKLENSRSPYYVFCADVERALTVLDEPQTLSDRVKRVHVHLQNHKWFQQAALIAGMLGAGLIGALNDGVKGKFKDLLGMNSSPTAEVKNQDEAQPTRIATELNDLSNQKTQR